MGQPLTSGQPQPAMNGDAAILQQAYRTCPPATFEELTGVPATFSSPMWRASGTDDDVTGSPPTAPAASPLEQRVHDQLVEITNQTFGITDPHLIGMVTELLSHDLSMADASTVMGIVVDSAFDEVASRDLRIGAQLSLDILLEKSDLARMFWHGACFRILDGTITDKKTIADDEMMRGIYNALLGHVVDNRPDSPLHYAAKTFLTYVRTGFEHILPSACKENAIQIRSSFADHDPSDLENLIAGLGEISDNYRTITSWLHRDSDEVVGEIEGLIDMLREGNAAQTLFAMNALPLVMQGGLSPDSPQLAKIADYLHHIMLFGIETHNCECAMAAFAQLRDILPPDKVEYIESHLGVQQDAYTEILTKVLQGFMS